MSTVIVQLPIQSLNKYTTVGHETTSKYTAITMSKSNQYPCL